MFLVLPKALSASKRQAEIIEVVLRHGWKYFRSRISKNSPPEKPSLPLPSVLRQILLELGPTFIKLGQLLSTRPDLLSPDYIKALETLQSDVPALPWSQVQPIVESAFGQPLSELFAEVEPDAIAAGSLAQVHKGRLLTGELVAIKVQRPGIRQVIESDLRVLRSLARWFSRDRLGQAYDLPGLVEEFKMSLLNELDFRREARNTDQLRNNLENSAFWKRGQVIVPNVYKELTTDTVLTLEWIEGVKLTQANLSEPRRKRVAEIASQLLMQQVFLDRFFHADPHPGNFLYVGDEEEDRIALLDCGMVAILDPRSQMILTDLLLGIVYAKPRAIAQAIRNLGYTRVDIDIRAVETAFDRLLRRFYTRPLSEINLAELLNEALRIPRQNNIQMPGTIGLFVKAIANVEGIARSLDPMFPFVEVARPVVERVIQRSLLGPTTVQETAQSSLYLSRLLTQFPQRLEILLDRLERSELGVNVGLRVEREFKQTWRQGTRRLSLAMIAVGSLIAGAILLGVAANGSSAVSLTVILVWSQGLLVAGVVLGIWIAIGRG